MLQELVVMLQELVCDATGAGCSTVGLFPPPHATKTDSSMQIIIERIALSY